MSTFAERARVNNVRPKQKMSDNNLAWEQWEGPQPANALWPSQQIERTEPRPKPLIMWCFSAPLSCLARISCPRTLEKILLQLTPTVMWLQLCLWFGVAASLPSFPTQTSISKFPTKPSLEKFPTQPSLANKKSGRSSRGLPREGLSWVSGGDSTTSSRSSRGLPREGLSWGDSTSSPVPTVRHCSSPSGSVDGRILVEEVISRFQDLMWWYSGEVKADAFGAYEAQDINDDAC